MNTAGGVKAQFKIIPLNGKSASDEGTFFQTVDFGQLKILIFFQCHCNLIVCQNAYAKNAFCDNMSTQQNAYCDKMPTC